MYAENGCWGQRFATWITDDSPRFYRSWGNGAAMRISSVGFLADTADQLIQWSDTTGFELHPTELETT